MGVGVGGHASNEQARCEPAAGLRLQQGGGRPLSSPSIVRPSPQLGNTSNDSSMKRSSTSNHERYSACTGVFLRPQQLLGLALSATQGCMR